MSEQHTHASTWKSKINALGPGIMMASAAVGGSHLIASTQAGALYGWQLALIIILTNLFKYPFFRFSAHYTLDTGKSLIEGYAEKSRVYLWVFLILCVISATINAGAVAIVTAAIVKMAIPSLTLNVGAISALIMASCLIILASGRYKALDNVSKIIIVSLTIATVAAAAIAMSRGMQMKPDFIEPTPWTLASTLPATATVFSTSTSATSPAQCWRLSSSPWARMCSTATVRQCKWLAANTSVN